MALQLGQLLIEQQLVSEHQLQFVLKEQQATNERLGECLVRLGFLTDSDVARALAKQLALPFIDLRVLAPSRAALQLLTPTLARSKTLLPVSVEKRQLTVAVSDPTDPSILSIVSKQSGHTCQLAVASESELRKAIERAYYLLAVPVSAQLQQLSEQLIRLESSVDVADVLHLLFTATVSSRATDLHFVPTEKTSRLLVRIDGLLRPLHIFPVSLHRQLIAAVKVRAGLDISRTRDAQDGRLTYETLGDVYDIRVSTVATNFGESVVLRFLPAKGGARFSVTDLGFDEAQQTQLRQIFTVPHGLVLIAGPTGSGKTTTLYAALREQDSIGKNILTIEDPIEYAFSMIRQTQVNEKAGYTFSSAIRTFLRQDPDIILVGEIRDAETASLAIRAALTGHLVLSTLHTNSALSAPARLIDLSISPYLLTTSLAGVLSQRLVRRLCMQCKKETTHTSEELHKYLPQSVTQPQAELVQAFEAGQCPECDATGFYGRLALAEVMKPTAEFFDALSQGAAASVLQATITRSGFRSIDTVGGQRLAEGLTSLSELRRVLG